MRRVLLVVALVVPAWIDVSVIYGVVETLVLGREAARLGLPDIFEGLAALQALPLLVCLWLTYRVWGALRG